MYTSGHDAKNFPEPSKFWPQRWTRDADGNYKGVSNPFASLPFAMGARSCIGRRIAETQITLTVAKVKHSNKKNFKILPLLLTILMVKHGFQLYLNTQINSGSNKITYTDLNVCSFCKVHKMNTQ
jgi:hypothetical protein